MLSCPALSCLVFFPLSLFHPCLCMIIKMPSCITIIYHYWNAYFIRTSLFSSWPAVAFSRCTSIWEYNQDRYIPFYTVVLSALLDWITSWERLNLAKKFEFCIKTLHGAYLVRVSLMTTHSLNSTGWQYLQPRWDYFSSKPLEWRVWAKWNNHPVVYSHFLQLCKKVFPQKLRPK